MKIIENNAAKPKKGRFVWCTNCNSKLEITDADMKPKNGRHYVHCPCCKQDFFAMTEAETTEAYYNK